MSSLPAKADARRRASIQAALMRWYGEVARDLPWRRQTDPYAIWVSEIMLQQTQVATVIPYYDRFLDQLPTIEALSDADEDTLHKLWKGLGYYRRAAFLRKGARYVLDAHGGKLPETYEELRAVPGMGEYTAGAVGSIAFGLPVPAVDGNVVRVFSRWQNDATPADTLRKRLVEEAVEWVVKDDPGAWNQALMELGATVCTPRNPKCEACPVQAECRAFEASTQGERPVKPTRKTPHIRMRVHVFVHRKNNLIWLEKRRDGGLLAGLWGFPLVEDLGQGNPGLEVLRYKHVFTHRTWDACVYLVETEPSDRKNGRWVERDALQESPIPTAFQPVVAFLTRRDLWSGVG